MCLALASRVGRGLKQLAEKVKNRHDAMRLAELDDRMLADIGLNRSDLRDAFAAAAVARPERRSGAARRRAARWTAADANRACVSVTTVAAELFGSAGRALLSADRSAGALFGLT